MQIIILLSRYADFVYCSPVSKDSEYSCTSSTIKIHRRNLPQLFSLKFNCSLVSVSYSFTLYSLYIKFIYITRFYYLSFSYELIALNTQSAYFLQMRFMYINMSLECFLKHLVCLVRHECLRTFTCKVFSRSQFVLSNV